MKSKKMLLTILLLQIGLTKCNITFGQNSNDNYYVYPTLNIVNKSIDSIISGCLSELKTCIYYNEAMTLVIDVKNYNGDTYYIIRATNCMPIYKSLGAVAGCLSFSNHDVVVFCDSVPCGFELAGCFSEYYIKNTGFYPVEDYISWCYLLKNNDFYLKETVNPCR